MTLVLWYQCNDLVVTDSSGFANNGVVNGTVTQVTGVPGQPNRALQFDGSTGYLTFTNLNSLIIPGAGQFTVFCWLKTVKSDGAIISLRNAGAGLLDFTIGNNGLGNAGTGSPSLIVRDDAGNALNSISGGNAHSVNDGNWHRLACTFDTSGNMKLYIDGSDTGLSASGAATALTTTITPALADSAVANEILNGAIGFLGCTMDDLRVYNTALSASQINGLGLSMVAGPAFLGGGDPGADIVQTIRTVIF